jgi:hypothetical protein
VNKKEAKKTFLVLDHAGFTNYDLKLIKVFCFSRPDDEAAS